MSELVRRGDGEKPGERDTKKCQAAALRGLAGKRKDG